MHNYVVKGGKPLRLGYTTGSCATAAATAGAAMLVTGEVTDRVLITLPAGEKVAFSVDDVDISSAGVTCSVKKDAGDDPDVTDGIRIIVTCEKIPSGVELRGGPGVGTVTSDGLCIPRGETAINPAPRKMIMENVRAVCGRHGYEGGLRLTVSAPGGEEIAQKTFNPRLGIVGGISILGTTGIVEPMSRKAVLDTIKLLIDKRKLEDADNILITPGNYGLTFCREHLGPGMGLAVKYGNFLGECLDYIAYKKFRRVLLVGHAGKLVKVVGGVMDTHSSVADCRMEIIAAHAACAGGNAKTARAIMAAKTTDEAIDILNGTRYANESFRGMLEKLLFHLAYRVKQELEIGVVVFNRDAVLMRSENAAHLAALFKLLPGGEKA